MAAGPFDRIELVEGDITAQRVDAIVNAANQSLLGGGGVDGAIHRAAGPELLAECRTLGSCPTGQARITKGYNLPASHVIHTVGPVYHDGRSGEPELLASCYRQSLRLAVENNCRTVAMPAISTGVYGYPMAEAARIALLTTATFLQEESRIDLVRFVLFGSQAHQTHKRVLDQLQATQS
ncbi:MAG TPA: O-acetyl-ADP-ribose deacetylase [Phycisphaerae bacterium]|nr:O-acetyl-ADP-ribose deacetylase [Phycisphaerae bacterium]